MKTAEDIMNAIEKTKQRINKAKSSAALTAAINEMSRLAWMLSLYEHQPSDKVAVCVIANAPDGAADGEAVKVAEGYRTWTHIKAWPTGEPNEIVLFPIDYADLIKVLTDLEKRGFQVRAEEKE